MTISSIDQGKNPSGQLSTNPSAIATLAGASYFPDDFAWQKAIERIEAWARSPRTLEEEDISPPSPSVLKDALAFSRWAKKSRLRGPIAVTPAVAGGIVFESRQGKTTQTCEIQCNGMAEIITIQAHRVVSRVEWPISALRAAR
ncbi:MAG: hypothetical protein JNJ88_16040 [Planctomycetes bacterium]|nr:hypothetical protein [Planctomycetota bacterium]